MFDPIVYRIFVMQGREVQPSRRRAAPPGLRCVAAACVVDLAFGRPRFCRDKLALSPPIFKTIQLELRATQSATQPQPPRVVLAAQRFLAQRGVVPGHRAHARSTHRTSFSAGPPPGQWRLWRRASPTPPPAPPGSRSAPPPSLPRTLAWSPAAFRASRSIPPTRPATTSTSAPPAAACGCPAMPARPHLEHRLQPAHRRLAALGGPRRVHQHRRAHRAAGRDGRDSGRHRRSQRRSRLLLRRWHSALHRRRKHLDPDPGTRCGGRPEHPRRQLHRRGFCRLCLEHRRSATGGGGRLAGVTKATLVERELRRHELRGSLLLHGQRRNVASGHHHRRQRQRRAGRRSIRFSGRRQRGHVGGLEPGAPVVHGRGALSRLLPVRRRHHLDAAGRISRAPDSPRLCPTNTGSTGRRLPHLSRRAGRQSLNPATPLPGPSTRQSGPGAVAGQVRHQRRRLQQLHHHLCQQWNTTALETSTLRERRPSPMATTTSRWPRFPPARTRCCWPAPTTCGSAAWPWAAPGATPPTPPPA